MREKDKIASIWKATATLSAKGGSWCVVWTEKLGNRSLAQARTANPANPATAATMAPATSLFAPEAGLEDPLLLEEPLGRAPLEVELPPPLLLLLLPPV